MKKMFLDMIMLIKQQIININEKQISVKNRTSHFYNDIINLKNFKSNLNQIKQKLSKSITKGLIFTTLDTLQ